MEQDEARDASHPDGAPRRDGPPATKYHGRIANTAGDGLLAEFASVVDAVECAVAASDGSGRQRTMRLRRTERIQFRIGINLGEIIVKEGTALEARRQHRHSP